ncbi:response regulator transcription factor [Desulfobulbus rhabdoformis]|uniref:response regulator n=1 Tax=Desulfobulbus rhabdoformis TaxID=34032 RepID=UPI0019630DD8|nr:response regulator transcription factor [Desulfobulbus rhabdoformis]MBM9615127.1 response regulator transcription factor [Desulfobulbus rhabdoformis]
MSIRVFLADDHPLFRAGLRLSFRDTDDLEIIGEAENSFSAVESISQLFPDIVLMDVDMPGLSGLAAIRMLRKTMPDLKVLVLSSYNDTEYIQESMRTGAVGYVLKSINIDELKQIIRSVHNNLPVISAYLVNLAMEEAPRTEERSMPDLTRREEDVLKHLAQGMGNKEIAETLYISVETVKSHVRNIYKKLELKNRIEASQAAMRYGLLIES